MDGVLDLFASKFDSAKASLDECGLSKHSALHGTDELLVRAQKELNVFPFHTVKTCWLRLYTDVRLLRAQTLLSNLQDDVDLTCEKDDKTFSDAVAELDYALIVADGGDEKRRELVQSVLALLADLVEEAHVEKRPAKRQRLQSPNKDEYLPTDLSPLPVIKTPVRRMNRPSLTLFEEWAERTRRPLVLEGIMDHWPALQRWRSPEYWLTLTLGGRRLVPLEIGQSYLDEDWRVQITPFRDFLSQYILPSDNDRKEVGYLAQHDLFRQIEPLRNDFVIPDFCYCKVPDASNDGGGGNQDQEEEQPDPEIRQNLWFGGRTVSPLHHDPYHNILCQVHGVKYVRLYSPQSTPQLYPRSRTEPAPHVTEQPKILYSIPSRSAEPPSVDTADTEPDVENTVSKSTQPHTIDMSNNSSVDIFAMELSPDEDWDETWPGISTLPYWECILREGEALYIPKGWWHYVRGLSSSGISVNFWW